MTKQSDLTLNGELVREMAALLEETGLTEIDYTSGDQRIRVSRSAVMVQSGPAPAAAAPVIAIEGPVAPAAEPVALDYRTHPGAVKSPMVGTVYLSPQPGAAVFMKVGDMVTEGQTLLIIEAMKVMNQIRATRAGKVTRILVADGNPVEYGEALLVLE